jgi:laccase
VLDVEPGKTYLLRLINAALYSEYYLKIAGHNFTVVAADASYVKPYTTDVIPVAPGETVDALVVADAPPGRYYMVALPTQAPKPEFQTPVHVTRGTMVYSNNNHSSGNVGAASLSPFHGDGGGDLDTPPIIMAPEMPDHHDKITSFYFHGNLTKLHHPQNPQVPKQADQYLFITLGLGSICPPDGGGGRSQSCKINGSMVAIAVATMNNVSFKPPMVTTKSMLEMHYYNTSDMCAFPVLPDRPPRAFNYTDKALVPRGPKLGTP